MEKNISINKFRNKFKKKNTTGAWIQLSDPNIAKIVSKISYIDWICLDLEHGLINVNLVPSIVDSVENSNKIILARISVHEINNIPKILDSGIDGFILANIRSIDQIKKVYKLCNYPPLGERGLGFSKFNDFKLNKKNISIRPIIIPMVENNEALNNINEIVKFKKLYDGIFIGPVDLSLSIGDNLKFSKKHNSAISKIKNICKKKSIPVGLHIIKGDKKELKRNFSKGFNFLAYLTDTVVLQNY
jgi:2-dehydro-3-deoxyglucarate aldolase